MASNYATLAKRIRSAKTKEELNKCWTSLDRLYNAGVFTAKELMRLDDVIFQQLCKLEEK